MTRTPRDRAGLLRYVADVAFLLVLVDAAGDLAHVLACDVVPARSGDPVAFVAALDRASKAHARLVEAFEATT